MAINHADNVTQSLDAVIEAYREELKELGDGARDPARRAELEPKLTHLEGIRGEVETLIDALHQTRSTRLRGLTG